MYTLLHIKKLYFIQFLLVCNIVESTTTANFHSTKSEFRFCAGSNPTRGVSEIAMVRISDNDPGWKLG